MTEVALLVALVGSWAYFLKWHREEVAALRKQAAEDREALADRLMSRNLGELAAVRNPTPVEPPRPSEPFDPDWEEPSFSRPADPVLEED
jgi:hypothetical protein